MKKIFFALSASLLLVSCTKDRGTSGKEENNLSETEFASKANAPGGRPLSAPLIGAEEAPGPGDPDGTGSVHLTLNQGQGTISFELIVENIEPATAAHIHKAPFGQPGPVVVGLTAPTNGFSSGTITNVSAELIKDIRKNPQDYYVNVHNAVYLMGAIRGQLSK